MKRATVSSVKAKAWIWFICILLLCIRIYLKSVLRYTFFILDAYHPESIYLREQGCEDLWLFCEAKMGSERKRPGRDLQLLFSLPSGHFSKGFLKTSKKNTNWWPFSWTIGLLRTGTVFRRFLISTKSAGCLLHVYRPSACVTSACTGWIFVKFNTGHFYYILSSKATFG